MGFDGALEKEVRAREKLNRHEVGIVARAVLEQKLLPIREFLANYFGEHKGLLRGNLVPIPTEGGRRWGEVRGFKADPLWGDLSVRVRHDRKSKHWSQVSVSHILSEEQRVRKEREASAARMEQQLARAYEQAHLPPRRAPTPAEAGLARVQKIRNGGVRKPRLNKELVKERAAREKLRAQTMRSRRTSRRHS